METKAIFHWAFDIFHWAFFRTLARLHGGKEIRQWQMKNEK
jgi:hypothetical protein